MQDDPDTNAHYRFRIGMSVNHPTLDLAPFLAPLDITPANSRVAGQPRVTPVGRRLPGTYKSSFWNWSRLVEGDRDFAGAALRLAETLAPHRALLQTLTSSGGTVAIRLALPGSMNIGACFPTSALARLVELGLDLDLEVFPHIGNFT